MVFVLMVMLYIANRKAKDSGLNDSWLIYISQFQPATIRASKFV